MSKLAHRAYPCFRAPVSSSGDAMRSRGTGTWEHQNLERAQGSIELVLVLMILVPLLLGGIELARGVGIRHSLDSGTGIATRTLSLDPTQWNWATSVINQAVTDNILGGGSVSVVTIHVYNASGTQITSAALAALPFGSTFRLEASCTYTPSIPLAGGEAVTIRVSHWGIVERYP